MAVVARRLLMEGEMQPVKQRNDSRGGWRLEMAEEEMRKGKRERGKKSRVRWYYGGLPVFGVGWKAKYRVQGPAAGLSWAQAPLQQAPGRSGPSAAVTSDWTFFFTG